MLEVEGIHSFYGKAHILDGLSFRVGRGEVVALLGRNGAGKSTLLNIISGAIPADSGRVVTDGTMSWPVGFGGSLYREMTGQQNVRFVARVYGVDTATLEAFVRDFAELGEHFYTPIRTYSAGMKARLGFGLSMGVPFDTYLIDETTAVGDARFTRKSRSVFRERVKSASAIMVSHQMKMVRNFCDSGLLMHEGQLTYFDDLDEAIALHLKLNG